MRISDFKQEEIININDGKRFGFFGDFDIDDELLESKKIVVENGKIFVIKQYENENSKDVADDIFVLELV